MITTETMAISTVNQNRNLSVAILSGTSRLKLRLSKPYRGAGSRLHGSMKVSAHLRFRLSRLLVEYQSSEHAARNFAKLRSCRVLRRWQLRHSQRRLSGVNARSTAAGPNARATSIASPWSISSDGSPHISQNVC